MNNAQRRRELLATWREARKACEPNSLPNGITVRYDDERVERFAAYALSDALLSELIADAERLDWWEQHLRYEHQMNFDPEEISDGVVDFYRVSGHVNDLERERIGTFPSLRAAIDAAMSLGSAAPSSPSRP